MESTAEVPPTIRPPRSHYYYAVLSMALAAICAGQAAGTTGGEVPLVWAATVILLAVWLIVAQHCATFRASSKGALMSVVLLPILTLYSAVAMFSHLAAPNRLTPPVIAGTAIVGLALLGFIILAARSNLRWSATIAQAQKSEGTGLPTPGSTLSKEEVSSAIGAASILLVTWLLFAQTVPANPEFYMKNIHPARARFHAPKTAVYLIVQGLPDETILAEWTDSKTNVERWLAEQQQRPGVTNFEIHDIAEPIEYSYPNSLMTWGTIATEEKGQRATWQEGDRQFEVLWDDEYQELFGEVPVNYTERNIPKQDHPS
ncbi:hypothetical protein AB1K70_23845 [Bremerella sp. JC770]|uniref:hypothetical protein n=1 Tax=Bremerella sp. JC770 TaxID=3232137 RepID=UPI00345996FF